MIFFAPTDAGVGSFYTTFYFEEAPKAEGISIFVDLRAKSFFGGSIFFSTGFGGSTFFSTTGFIGSTFFSITGFATGFGYSIFFSTGFGGSTFFSTGLGLGEIGLVSTAFFAPNAAGISILLSRFGGRTLSATFYFIAAPNIDGISILVDFLANSVTTFSFATSGTFAFTGGSLIIFFGA
jgi:hypothetical protein